MTPPQEEPAPVGGSGLTALDLKEQIADLERTNQALFDMVNDLSLFYNLSLSFLREARAPEQLAQTLLTTLTDEAGFHRCAIAQFLGTSADDIVFWSRTADSTAIRQEKVRLSGIGNTLLHRCLTEGRGFHSKTLTPAERLPTGFGFDAKQFVLVPLDGRERRIGAIWVDNGFSGEPITTERFDSLKMLAGQVALTLDNLRLNVELEATNVNLQEQRDELNILYTIVGKIASEHDLERLEGLVIDVILETMDVSTCALVVFPEGALVARCLWRAKNEATIKKGEIDLSGYMGGGADGIAARLRDAGVLRPMLESSEAGKAFAYFEIPIRIRDRDIGVLSVSRAASTGFSDKIRELFGKISAQIAVALDQARLYDLTITDGLTNLRARRYFQIRLAEMVKESERYRRALSLVMMDIDHFKRINDTYGHPIGDVVLRNVSKIVRATIRETDVAARYGGEEFAVILPETDQIGAAELAERLRRCVEESVSRLRDGQSLQVTISAGIATMPKDASSRDDLIQKADEALYRAKTEGRNRVCLASSAVEVRS